MKYKKYEMQFIDNFQMPVNEIPGINVPKIKSETSIYGGSSGGGTVVAKMSASSNQLFQAALVTVPLNTSEIAIGATNDTSTYKITIITAGYYQITGKISWDTPTAGASYWTYIYKNGGALASMITQPAAATAFSGICTTVAYLEAGDYIQLKGYQNSGNNVYSRTVTDLFICKV